MAIGYVVKHNRLPLKSLLFYSVDTVLSEEGIEVGAVDVDFAAYLREGDEALVAVVLPRLGGICRGAFEQLRILSIRCWSRWRCAG